MEVNLEEISTKKLFGKRMITTLGSQDTSALWRPFRQAINKKEGLNPSNYYSIQRYGKEMQNMSLSLNTEFEKCAAVEAEKENCPDEFEGIVLDGGKYATFEYARNMGEIQVVMMDFLSKWLPKSGFELDDRNHFETFGPAYDPFTEDSVELIWVPIKEKGSN